MGTSEEQPPTIDEAMRTTHRSRYLPPDQQAYAGLDRAMPIGHGQTNSQPSTVRAMLTALDARPGHRVLDVGAGSGWTTVILALIVGYTGRVFGVELVPQLAEWGRANVEFAGLPWATEQEAAPRQLGLPAEAPFDRILVSAAAKVIPDALVEQLSPDGVMVVPVRGQLVKVRPGHEPQLLGRYVFVPLIDPGQE